MNIFTATRQLAFIGKLFAAAKLNLDEFVAGNDETALQAHIASLQPVAAAPADTSAKDTEIANLKSQLSTATTQLVTLNAALTKSGIKAVAADPKLGLQETDLTAAIEARISMKAGELTAALGTKPIEAQVVVDPKAAAKPVDPKLTGIDRTRAAFAAQRAAARS